MKFEELKSLFPVTVQLTQEMIDKGAVSDNMDIYSCNGAQVLKSILPSPYDKYATWAVETGTVKEFPTSHYLYNDIPEKEMLRIEARDSNGDLVDMMEVTEPTEITLQLYS